jgi:site-specific DNA recombinase
VNRSGASASSTRRGPGSSGASSTNSRAAIPPRTVAGRLNAEKIAGPSSRSWGASTIHGHRARGTGILHNDLYVGRVVWNKLRNQKDPTTGKRVSRLNPEKDWIVKEGRGLRIVPDDLWQEVKERVSLVAPGQFGCQTARNKGPAVCANRARMAVTDREETILGARIAGEGQNGRVRGPHEEA